MTVANRLTALLAALLLAGPCLAQSSVDPKLPEYKSVTGVSGSIKSIGSDTMNNLMTYWGEGFKKLYPSVTIEIEGKGSNTAPPALIEGTANFGPMSREMKEAEIKKFEERFGYKPTAVRTSLDVLAIYVHKDNPIKKLSLEQVDAIFSKNRKGGFAKEIKTWGDLGLTGEWEDRPLSLYGRNSESGTYVYFKDHALFGGDFKDSVKEQIGTAQVVKGVAQDKSGIGYGGIGYKTEEVRAVPLIGKGKTDAFEATMENAYSGKYPLARFLYVYINHKPNTEVDLLRREFIRFILSKDGQEIVLKDGYIPITAAVANKSLEATGLAKPKVP